MEQLLDQLESDAAIRACDHGNSLRRDGGSHQIQSDCSCVGMKLAAMTTYTLSADDIMFVVDVFLYIMFVV
jgi:hypothetical protein